MGKKNSVKIKKFGKNITLETFSIKSELLKEISLRTKIFRKLKDVFKN